MKCFELTHCSEEERSKCYVWNTFSKNIQDLENIKCWILKSAYQSDNKNQLQKCQQCSYYVAVNKESGIVAHYDPNAAIIACEGTINNDKTKALEKVWENIRENGKSNVILDLTNVNNIYSCGLGMIVKIHKESAAAGGLLVVAGIRGYVQTIFSSTKLSRIIKIAADLNQAASLFEIKRQELEKAANATPKAPIMPKKRVPCWEYFENHNPRNANKCDECYKKVSQSKEPCWIVDGMIEGVSFQYVNEECENCSYFIEFYAGGVEEQAKEIS